MTAEIAETTTSNTLAEDFASRAPDRIKTALEALDRAAAVGPFVPLATPRPEILDAFEGEVPTEVVALYLRVLDRYPAFQPRLAPGDNRAAMLEAIMRHGRGDESLVHIVALHIRTEFHPAIAVEDSLLYLANSGQDEAATSLTAKRLVDMLLDSPQTRAPTIKTMRHWMMIGALPEVVEGAKARLDDRERAQLADDGD